MGRYIISTQAEEDLTTIILYIAEDNLDAAGTLHDRFYEVFEMLAENPLAGRERQELPSGFRSFPMGSYLIFYRIWTGDVGITRICHAARDMDELFS